ncbi:M1 family metallopeptidase [Flagellimonas allohymeniacidonis]|uniref:M1 family peptidase n=1 Tax=Flagellimonas allohymeniacidonis TaxID=2517819 RepID=A0A4Q8QBA0_9FLAO|nr:M1 family metallopeptidase [Allomuricauda hymeniacidonis]TAI47615.1 M1 family peptidase [Allomuricauda hymeniacidonis]
MKRVLFYFAWIIAGTLCANAQTGEGYWQQHVDYTMNVNMDVETYKYGGTQKLVYTNNSPDTLNRVFYHLYYNAFQPGSEMDIRLQTIKDPDKRMMENGESRISKLSESEMGYLHATSLTQDGVPVEFQEEGTILVVDLPNPIAPGAKTTLDMTFEGQVPLQVRRSGRNSSEGVALSMSQWYPKLSEYDFEGWHPNPYIAREFHGVWGNFDVKLTLDKDYVVGGSGYLQNPQEIGHGYETSGTKVKTKGKALTWHFVAPNVHDFMWAADPDYIHDMVEMEDGPTLHFFYKNEEELLENWKNLQPKTEAAMRFFNTNIGKYPYEQYSVVQGGDGGMEYAMSTLITGRRQFSSLVGVMVHEMAHSWFQHVLATDEAKYEWMDEGFTSFISSLCMNQIMEQNKENPFEGSYKGYYALVNSGLELPQTTHADRYATNFAYGVAAYSKGAIFLSQLGYVIGQDKLMETIRKYYDDFKFKHPVPNDIKRTAEKVSGMQLDWYLTDWTATTNTIDYGIKSVASEGDKTKVVLERIGLMPMPLDILLVKADGTQETFYVPLQMMRGEKENPYAQLQRTVLDDWAWAYSTYEFVIDQSFDNIQALVLDPSQLMADVNGENNVYQAKP